MLPETTRVPSGLKATLSTSSVWPDIGSLRTTRLGCMSPGNADSPSTAKDETDTPPAPVDLIYDAFIKVSARKYLTTRLDQTPILT